VGPVDSMTDWWFGYGLGGCYDGIAVAFERTRGSKVTSGVGNSSCSEHYKTLRKLVLQVVDQHTQSRDISEQF
jgi:hypothetical protein